MCSSARLTDSGLPQPFSPGLSLHSHGHNAIGFPVHRQPAPRAGSDINLGRDTRKLALLHSRNVKGEEAERDCFPMQGRPQAQGPQQNTSLASRRVSHVTNIPCRFQDFGYL